MPAKHDIPADFIDWFTMQGDVVCWIDADVDRSHMNARMRRKLAPFGQRAGGRPVHGRGAVVTLASRLLLTCDIMFALTNQGAWPWELSDAVPHVPGGDDGAALAIIHKTWKLEGGAIMWAITVGDGNEAGMIARGTELSGPRGSMLTRSGVGYLASDVKHALVNNCFPWQLDK